MLFQGALHLEGANTVAHADNHIIGAPHEPEVAVLVFIGTVPCNIPVPANTGIGGIGIAPVFLEHPRRALWLDTHSDIALFIGRQLVAIVVDHADSEARRWLTHRYPMRDRASIWS